MREFSVPAPFTVEDNASVVRAVYDYEREDPNQAAFSRLIDDTWTPVTYAEAAAQIRAVANGLIAKGVAPGDRVALISATRYEWTIIDYAVLSIGAITVPIYETSSADQVRWVLQDSAAVALFVESDAHAKIAEELAPELPNLRTVFHIASTSAPAALDELAEAGAGVDP
ncbi:AMP-binding protein, partial [Mycobacteroides abscessus subsp. abscessus]